jgi:hypothetical protein
LLDQILGLMKSSIRCLGLAGFVVNGRGLLGGAPQAWYREYRECEYSEHSRTAIGFLDSNRSVIKHLQMLLQTCFL